MFLKLRNRLLKVQAAMKLQVDSKRKDISYNIGDWVYVKMKPYRQSSISNLHIINYLKGFMVIFKSQNRLGQLLIVWIYPLVQRYTPCFIALCWNFTKVHSFTILIHYHRIPKITIPWFNFWLFWTANGILLLRHLLSWYWCSGLVWLWKTQARKRWSSTQVSPWGQGGSPRGGWW